MIWINEILLCEGDTLGRLCGDSKEAQLRETLKRDSRKTRGISQRNHFQTDSKSERALALDLIASVCFCLPRNNYDPLQLISVHLVRCPLWMSSDDLERCSALFANGDIVTRRVACGDAIERFVRSHSAS